MKKINHIRLFWIMMAIAALLFLLSACGRTVYVPVETVRIEYKDRFQRDSVYLFDSIMIKMANDTVWLEKYKFAYRDRIVRDSVFISDTIQVPYPVTEYREVNRLKSWQSFLVWSGVIALTVLFGSIGFKLFRFIK